METTVLELPASIDPALVERFWASVDRPADWETSEDDLCWSWLKSCGSNDTPQFAAGGGVTLNAVRVAWELSGMGSTRGFRLKNTCDNRICVRPSHQVREESPIPSKAPRGIFVEFLPEGSDPLEAIMGGKRAQFLERQAERRASILNGTAQKIRVDVDVPLVDPLPDAGVRAAEASLPSAKPMKTTSKRGTANGRLRALTDTERLDLASLSITMITVTPTWAIVHGRYGSGYGKDLRAALDNLAVQRG